MWRWLKARRSGTTPSPRQRLRIDAALRIRLAYWRGNVMALHRELVEEEKVGVHRLRASQHCIARLRPMSAAATEPRHVAAFREPRWGRMRPAAFGAQLIGSALRIGL